MAIKLGREIVRTLAAGVVVHFGMVMACSYEGGLPHYADEPSEGSRLDGNVPDGEGDELGEQAEQTAQQDRPDASPGLLVPVKEAKANESGSRLKARYYAGADGSRQFLNWLDSEFDAECYFTDTGDGTLRCIPWASVSTTAHFADSQCKQLLFSLPSAACGTSPTIARALIPNTFGTCAQQYKYYQPGTKTAPVQVYALSGANCISQPVDAKRTYWFAGAELPISSFVSGEIVTE